MTSRFSLAPWLMGLTAASALVGCSSPTADIQFKQDFHLGEKVESAHGIPGGVPIEIWGLVGGTFRTVDIKNRGGGLLQGVDLPDGKLYYRNGGRWIVTDAHAVVWQNYFWGRRFQSDVPEGTKVATTVSGLAPWSTEPGALHQLNVWASGNTYAFPVLNSAVPANAESATITLRDLKAETDGADIYLPALKGKEGDTLHLAQMVVSQLTDASGMAAFEGDVAVSVARGAILKDELDLPDGITFVDLEPTLSATIAAGPLRTLDVNLRGSDFDEVIAAAGGSLTGEHASTRIVIRPDLQGGLARTEVGSLPFAVSASALTPAVGSPAARLTWSDTATAGAPMHVAFGRMYDSNGLQVEAGIVKELGEASSLDLSPLVGAPGAILIDSVPVTAGMNVSNSSPLVSWSAPSVGTAHGYEVRIVRKTTDDKFISEVLLTRETQLRLPPIFFKQNEERSYTFAIIVTALNDAAEGFPETRQQPKAPYGYAARATAFFTTGQQ